MNILISFLVFISSATTISLLISQIQNHLTVGGALTALILGILVGVLAFCFCRKRDLSIPSLVPFDYLISFLFSLFFARQFLWVYFFRDGSLQTLSANAFGDLPLHLDFIAQFARGVPIWPRNPIFPYVDLHYPFGVDLLTAVFVKLHIPLETILPVLGILGTLCILVSLLAWGKGFAVAAFLFSGGFAGFEFLSHFLLKDYQADLAWKSLSLALLLPQRGFLFAFPIGLVLLWSWRRRFLQGKQGMPVYIEALLYGTLPIIHLHTFFFLSILIAIWTIALKNYRKVAPLLALAFIPATYETLFVSGFFKQGSLIWIESGWMVQDQNIIWFFLKNYGLFVPLAWYACFLSIKVKSREHRLLVIPALSIYYILLFVMFAPWDWDNTKIMVWCYILLLPSLSELILDQLKPLFRYPLYIILFFSGFISILSAYVPSNKGFEIVPLVEYDGVCNALKDIDATAIFAVSQKHNHPVMMCGQTVVVGYAGHLWSHGLKAEPIVKLFNRFMAGESDWKEIAHELNIQYVFWGSREQSDFPNSHLPFMLDNMKLTEGPWGKIYDLKEIK